MSYLIQKLKTGADTVTENLRFICCYFEHEVMDEIHEVNYPPPTRPKASGE
jgi:hypothetical protein